MSLPYAYTPNYRIPLPRFDTATWHDQYYQAMYTLDAVLRQYTGVLNITGVWANSTAYAVSDKAIDSEDGTIWQCMTAHTSASSGTFAADRAARSALWQEFTTSATFRGTWATATIYNAGDFVVSGYIYAIALDAHVSGASFGGDAAHWSYLVDLTTPVTAAAASAAAAAISAASAASAASTALASRTINTTEGVQGGGTLAADLTLKLDVNGLTTDTAPALTDPIVYYKTASTAHRKMSLQSLWNTVNSLTAYTTLNVADEIPVRDGSGGGNGVRKITAQNFFNGFNVLTALTAPVAADKIAIYDTTGGAAKTVTFANLLKNLNNITAHTTPALADLIAIYDSSGAAGKGITFANFMKAMNLLTQDTAPDGVNDFLMTYDASAAAAKRATPLDVVKGAILLQTLTASSSASLNFTGVSNTLYRGYLCVLSRILPATNGADLWMRASTDQGSTLRSGIEYVNAQFGAGSAGSGNAGSLADTKCTIHAGLSNTGRGASGLILITCGTAAYDFQFVTLLFGVQSAGPASAIYISGGENNQANVNGFGILQSSGNIASGTMLVYGLPK